MKLDPASSRLLGADSRGYDYFIVKSIANPTLTELCLAYFVGSESPGVICATSLPLNATVTGLGSATLYGQPFGESQSAQGEWVGDFLNVEVEPRS